MLRRPTWPTLFPYTTLFRSTSRPGEVLCPPNGRGRFDRAWSLTTTTSSSTSSTTSPRRERRNPDRSEEHTSELQSHSDLVCRLLLEKKKCLEPAHSAHTEHD